MVYAHIVKARERKIHLLLTITTDNSTHPIHLYMLPSGLSTTLLRLSSKPQRSLAFLPPATTTTTTLHQRPFHNTTMASKMMSENALPEGHKSQDAPPAHKLVHFKNLTNEVREFGTFRKVLHTGLYSQLVAMEIPVGGDIGDEVHTVDQIL